MRLQSTITAAILVSLFALLPAAAPAAGPSKATAARYAARTYVEDAALGRRRFALEGAPKSVRAKDGSRITAWHIGLADAGDGSGEAVLLFRGARFLGWASDRLTIHVGLSRRGTAIKVRYGVYSGNDPFCCPHRYKTVRYRWTGKRIAADATPPLTYGRRGTKLHLSG